MQKIFIFLLSAVTIATASDPVRLVKSKHVARLELMRDSLLQEVQTLKAVVLHNQRLLQAAEATISTLQQQLARQAYLVDAANRELHYLRWQRGQDKAEIDRLRALNDYWGAMVQPHHTEPDQVLVRPTPVLAALKPSAPDLTSPKALADEGE